MSGSLVLGAQPERSLPEEWSDHDLRPEIATSWWRSKILGVKPGLPIEAVVAAEMIDSDERLRQSLRPILDDLVSKLSGTNCSILLADHRAVIIDRRWTTKSVQEALDRFAVMPGYDYGESCMGTNGVGTAAEERKLVRVAGSEHYAEILKSFSCLGVPLVHPLTRRLTGVLDLTFPPSDEHPLMVPFIVDAGRQIEGMLAEWASHGQRAQFEWFLSLGRRKDRPVLSLMDDAVLLNRAARELDPIDQAALVRAAEDLGAADSGESLTLTLTGSDEPVSVSVYHHSNSGRFPGVVLEVAAARRRRTAPRRSAVLPGLAGSSPAWSTFCSEAATVAGTDLPTLIAGEPGAGKFAVARSLHEWSGREQLVVVDAATFALDGRSGWLSKLRRGLSTPDCTVIVRHLHQCDTALAAAIAAEIDQHSGRAGVVIGTINAGASGAGLQALLERFCVRLSVPSLRERAEDIPDLVRAVLERRSCELRFHPSALAALGNKAFPENVRTLERVVLGVAAKRRVGDVLVGDLPPLGETEGPSHLTAMERAERDAIVKALRENDGNKAAAAAALGISRPTLYRKMGVYKINGH